MSSAPGTNVDVSRPSGLRLNRNHGLVAAGVLVPLAVLFIPRDSPPDPKLFASVDQYVEMARAEGAETLAPGRLNETLERVQQARLASASQHGRLPLLRRYGGARAHLGEALQSASRLLDQTRAAVHRGRQDAGDAIENATRRLTRARAAAGSAHVGKEGRSALMQAGIALDEARRAYDRGAYGQALDRAREVLRVGSEWETRSSAKLSRFRDAESLDRWGDWIEETVRWSAAKDDYAIVVDKVDKELVLYLDGKPLVTFPVDLGLDPVSQKLREGDNSTPEGRYTISEVRAPGQTSYHRALLLDYPNTEDRQRFDMAVAEGSIPADARIGGLIEIHGMGGRNADWTNGCVALTNRDMDALVDLVRVGTPVTIVGRRPDAGARGRAEPGA